MILKRKETNKRGAAASVCGWTGTRQTARCGRGSDKQHLQRVSVSRCSGSTRLVFSKESGICLEQRRVVAKPLDTCPPKMCSFPRLGASSISGARQQRPEWLLHAGTTLLTGEISLCPSSSLAESHYSIFPFISTRFPFISVCVSLKSL